jgi:hypothetical protein
MALVKRYSIAAPTSWMIKANITSNAFVDAVSE